MFCYKKAIKKILPQPILDEYRRFRLKSLINEINGLNIESMGVDDDMPWVRLRDGLIFFGIFPSDKEIKLHHLIRKSVLGIKEECFGVVLEIVDRYLAPRSLPGELTLKPSDYSPIRDPLNDFDIDNTKKENLADLFALSEGDVVLDIGAFHGFGTMRMAEYIGKKGKIIAIEANPESHKILMKNIKENMFSNIIVVQKAISNYKSESGSFYYDGVPTGNSLRGDVLKDLGSIDMVKLDIEIDTADNVLESLGVSQVNHVSITVNGGEPDALSGLSRTIARSDDIFITMPGWYHRDGERIDNILGRQLDDMGITNVMKGRLGRVIAWR